MLTGIHADLAIDTGIDFSKLDTFGTVQQAILSYGKSQEERTAVG